MISQPAAGAVVGDTIPPVVTMLPEDSRGMGATSLRAFILGLGMLAVPTTVLLGAVGDSIAYGLIGLAALYLVAKNDPPSPSRSMTFNEVRMRAFFLGWGFSCGLKLVGSFSQPFGIKEYGIAALASVIEFHVEFYLLPWTKSLTIITYIGMALCVGGELIRKLSMLTASKNFTHLVRHQKADGQYLVTSGPYALCRHPGYAGWFWWSIGTQLVLVNPICFVGYCFAVYKFFYSRIYYEEICLLSFFGLEYVNYQIKVPRTGVPFVKGYLTHMPNDDASLPDDDNDDDED